MESVVTCIELNYYLRDYKTLYSLIVDIFSPMTLDMVTQSFSTNSAKTVVNMLTQRIYVFLFFYHCVDDSSNYSSS